MAENKLLINEEQRTIYLYGEINEAIASELNFYIINTNLEDDECEKQMKNYERTPIILHINSVGGAVRDMWSMIDTIEISKTPIHTFCTGYAYSAGMTLFLSGHQRFATRHAKFMYHTLSGCSHGTYEDISETTKELELTQNEIEEYVLSKTKITKDQLENVRKYKQDWYIRGTDVETLGITTVSENEVETN